MTAIANVALSDTFNTQRVKLNRAVVRLNNFAQNESQIAANTLFANVAFTGPSISSTTHLNTISGRTSTVSANLNVGGSFSNITSTLNTIGGVKTTVSANLNVGGSFSNITCANTNIKGKSLLVTSNSYFTGTLEINGLTATTSNTVAGAITEVSDNTIAFSIALG